MERPLVLENITYHFSYLPEQVNQTDFFNELTTRTGCGLLLDLENIHINAENHNFDPYTFIDEMPLSNVVQVHLAGGYKNSKGIYVDSHSKPVSEPTWQLLNYLIQKTNIKVIILEHDNDFPEDFNILLNQLRRAKSLLKKSEANHDCAKI